MRSQGSLGHRSVIGKVETPPKEWPEDDHEFMREVRNEFALAIARDVDAALMHYLLEHYWTCFCCGQVYWRNVSPVKCQVCGSALFDRNLDLWESPCGRFPDDARKDSGDPRGAGL